MNIDIKGLANYTENMACFKDSFISVLHEYNGSGKDKEMLAFVACCFMTPNAKSDKKDVEHLLSIIREQTTSVWEYIDREMYMVDFFDPSMRTLSFANDMDVLKVFMLLHEVILTTQTIERSVQISYDYNGNYEDFFINIFNSAGVKDIFYADRSDPQERIWTFLRLMVRKSPVDLGLWGNWITPADLQMPINENFVRAAYKMKLYDNIDVTPASRRRITDAFKTYFPDDPVKGFFAIHGFIYEIS